MINTGGGQRLLLTTNTRIQVHVFCSKFAEEKNSVKIAETSSCEAKTCTSGGTRGPRIRVYLVFYANVELQNTLRNFMTAFQVRPVYSFIWKTSPSPLFLNFNIQQWRNRKRKNSTEMKLFVVVNHLNGLIAFPSSCSD